MRRYAPDSAAAAAVAAVVVAAAATVTAAVAATAAAAAIAAAAAAADDDDKQDDPQTAAATPVIVAPHNAYLLMKDGDTAFSAGAFAPAAVRSQFILCLSGKWVLDLFFQRKSRLTPRTRPKGDRWEALAA